MNDQSPATISIYVPNYVDDSAVESMLRRLPCAPRLPGASEGFLISESQNEVEDLMIAIYVRESPYV